MYSQGFTGQGHECHQSVIYNTDWTVKKCVATLVILSCAQLGTFPVGRACPSVCSSTGLETGARKGLCHGNHGCEDLWGCVHWASFSIKADVWSGSNAQIVADSVEAWEYWASAHGVAVCWTSSSEACLLQHQGQVPNRRDLFSPLCTTCRFIENSNCWWTMLLVSISFRFGWCAGSFHFVSVSFFSVLTVSVW